MSPEFQAILLCHLHPFDLSLLENLQLQVVLASQRLLSCRLILKEGTNCFRCYVRILHANL